VNQGQPEQLRILSDQVHPPHDSIRGKAIPLPGTHRLTAAYKPACAVKAEFRRICGKNGFLDLLFLPLTT
jgi:hypothetical protein